MTPKLFVNKYLSDALKVEKETGIPFLSTLTQAAIESAWGAVAPGNMFFGQKDTDGINGNEQLLLTTEYHSTATVKYPKILGITSVVISGRRLFKYKIKDWFRKYPTPADCFKSHAEFFLKNKRYAFALKVKHDPYKFMDAIAKAGYATDPNYAKTLRAVAKLIEKQL